MFSHVMILNILLSIAQMGGDIYTLKAVATAFGLGTMFESRVKYIPTTVEVR